MYISVCILRSYVHKSTQGLHLTLTCTLNEAQTTRMPGRQAGYPQDTSAYLTERNKSITLHAYIHIHTHAYIYIYIQYPSIIQDLIFTYTQI